VLDAIRASARERAGDEPAERRKLLAQLFDRVWQDGGSIVAVKPRAPFARYFATVADIQAVREIPETPDEVRGWIEIRVVVQSSRTRGIPSRGRSGSHPRGRGVFGDARAALRR
jgi:hypothetical protein